MFIASAPHEENCFNFKLIKHQQHHQSLLKKLTFLFRKIISHP